jgi:hypothetical protein
VRSLYYAAGCVAIVFGCQMLMAVIGILAYGVLAGALAVCIGYWVAG